jgi:hypothetical protein
VVNILVVGMGIRERGFIRRKGFHGELAKAVRLEFSSGISQLYIFANCVVGVEWGSEVSSF